jgi:thermostable 8-oxoguanine DNA glycosylase
MNNDLVTWRWERNVEGDFSRFSRDAFWKEMVVCLLTTQARSGPNSAVARFADRRPFPLSYRVCRQRRGLESLAEKTLARSGIRRNVTIGEQINENFRWLEKQGGWEEVRAAIRELKRNPILESESKAADFIICRMKGFGPKQSRNLLQNLGLTKYEVPIDSRIVRFLKQFGFPVSLSSKALADLDYYKFVSQGFRELCDACDIYPCMLDAAIWSSFDA